MQINPSDITPRPQLENAAQPALWYSYARHGGKPISHYIGDFGDALAEALRYQRRWGGTLHIEQVQP